MCSLVPHHIRDWVQLGSVRATPRETIGPRRAGRRGLWVPNGQTAIDGRSSTISLIPEERRQRFDLPATAGLHHEHWVDRHSGDLTSPFAACLNVTVPKLLARNLTGREHGPSVAQCGVQPGPRVGSRHGKARSLVSTWTSSSHPISRSNPLTSRTTLV